MAEDISLQARMSMGDHLDELRRRVIYSLIGVGVAAAAALVVGSAATKSPAFATFSTASAAPLATRSPRGRVVPL